MAKRVYLLNIIDHIETDLGDDARILFVLPNGAEIEVAHAGRQDPIGTLSVRVTNGTVRVMPRVSNVVCIEVTDATNVRKRGRAASKPDL